MRSSYKVRRIELLVLAAVVAATLTSAPAFAQSDREDEARTLFEAGRLAYDSGHFEDARDDFERAYELSGRPELLYNIGQCADRLRDDPAAIDAFERYIVAVPDAANRPQVEVRLSALRDARDRSEAVDVSDAEPEHAVETAVPTAEPPARDDTWLWAGVGIGVGAAAAIAIIIAIVVATSSPSIESPIPGVVGPGGIVIALGSP